jgi:membrane protease YdiL (CAAX protease family)
MTDSTATQSESQYSLIKILGIWIAVVAPIGILNYILKPAISPDFNADPIGAAKVKVMLLTLGLIWQFALAMIIVFREEGDLTWATIKRRFRLSTPRDPKTGEPRRRLWWWLILFICLLFLSFTIAPLTLDRWWVSLIPAFAAPPDGNIGEVLAMPGVAEKLMGDWFFVGLFLLMSTFNILGEESIFRGVLLPKMGGVFGSWDWVANGVLFGFYHIHQPWMMLGAALFATIALALPAKRFRSTWMAVIVHSLQFLVVLPGIIIAALGLG